MEEVDTGLMDWINGLDEEGIEEELKNGEMVRDQILQYKADYDSMLNKLDGLDGEAAEDAEKVRKIVNISMANLDESLRAIERITDLLLEKKDG